MPHKRVALTVSLPPDLARKFDHRGPFAGTVSPFLMREIEKATQRAIGIPAL